MFSTHIPRRTLRFGGALRRWLAVLLLLAAWPALAAPEYEVKAAHLPKFAGYIQWPAGALPGSTLVIGIVGRDPSGGTIERALGGASVGGRRIELRYVAAADPEALRECNILFVSGSEAGRTGEILRHIQGRPIVTVGESDDFASGGGMLQFIIADGQVRFVANPRAAARSGLQMDSGLLRVARRVTGN